MSISLSFMSFPSPSDSNSLLPVRRSNLASALEVAQPPLRLVAAPIPGEPRAWKIENREHHDPHSVHGHKTVPVTIRNLVHPEASLPQPPHRLVRGMGQQNGREVDDIEMEYVKHERNVSENYKRLAQILKCTGSSHPVGDCEHDQRRPKRHQQVLQRRRILLRIEETHNAHGE